MFNYQNHGISTLVVIGIITVLVVVVGGGILGYQYVSLKKITSSTPSITVISPNGGEILNQDTNYTIKWNYSGLDKNDEILLILRSSSYDSCYLGRSTVGKGSFDFTPKDVICPGDTSTNRKSTDLKSGGKYMVQLIVEKYSEGKGVSDTSDNYFTINPDNQTVNWKTYTNTQYGFEFKYPPLISLSEDGGVIKLSHSIVYPHPDPCDFVGNGPLLSNLFDFLVSITISDDSIENVKKSNFVWNYEEFTIGTLNGFKGERGIEGCGIYIYLFPISKNKTMIVERSYITQFINPIGDRETYLNLPGIIPPSQEEDYFNQILSTFKFTK